MADDKWTIRRVSEDARVMIEEVHEMTGVPYGRLVSETIGVWFDLMHQKNPAMTTNRFFPRC